MTLSQKYHPRKYKKNDEKQIVKLLKLVFDDWPETDFQGTVVDHWKWKYLDAPIKMNNTIVAESEGKIMGVTHGTSLKIKVGNNNYLGHVGSDVAVHPKYRGMGVYTKISKLKNKQHFEHGYNIMYWQTFNPILLNAQSWEGREARSYTHPIMSLVRIQDVDKHLKYNKYDSPDIVLKYGYLSSKAINSLKQNKMPKKSNGFEVKTVSSFDIRINYFWDKVKDDYDFIVCKTMDYLNWRYCDPRGGKYKVLLAKDKDNILGYLVFKLNQYREDYPIGFIIDVLALPGRGDIIETLILNALDWFDSLNVNVVHAKMIKGHPYVSRLIRCGFVDSRRNSYFSYSPFALGDDLNKFVNASPARVHFQYGESEQF